MLTRWPLPDLEAINRTRQYEFDPGALLYRLTVGGVRFTVIGGVGEVLHGAPLNTDDLDIVPHPDEANRAVLCTELNSIHASLLSASELSGPGVDLAGAIVAATPVLQLNTDLGRLDVVNLADAPSAAMLSDTEEASVHYDSVRMDLGGFEVAVASLDWLIATRDARKRAGSRQVPLLLALRDEVNG